MSEGYTPLATISPRKGLETVIRSPVYHNGGSNGNVANPNGTLVIKAKKTMFIVKLIAAHSPRPGTTTRTPNKYDEKDLRNPGWTNKYF